jgi:hypothetical protein
MLSYKRANRFTFAADQASAEAQFSLKRIDKKFLVCLWAGLFILCGWWWLFDTAPTEILRPVTVIVLLSCIPILDLMRKGKGAVINPALVFCATFTVVYAFSAFNSFDSIFVDLNMDAIMPRALWWACAGLALFLLGYYMPIADRLVPLAPRLNLQFSNRKLQYLCRVCIVILSIRYISHYVGIGQYTSFLEGFDLLLIATLTMLSFSADPPSSGIGSNKWHAILSCLVVSTPALISGFRGLFVLPWIILITSLYWAQKRFPWKLFTALALSTYFIIIPITSFYKTARQRDGLSIAESVNYTVDELEKVDLIDYLGEKSGTIKERYAIMPIFSVIVDRTGETVPYQEGGTYLNFFLNFIPRFVWPDKPSVNGFSNSLPREYGIIGFDDEHTSVGLGMLGEAWTNFGYVGLLFFMPLYGIIYRFLFGWILVKSDFSKAACAIYMPILWQLAQQENVLVNNIGAIFKFLLLMWLFTLFLPTAQRNKTSISHVSDYTYSS